ncbi:MAG: amidohydrolase family protein [Acidobacteriota bacterium]
MSNADNHPVAERGSADERTCTFNGRSHSPRQAGVASALPLLLALLASAGSPSCAPQQVAEQVAARTPADLLVLGGTVVTMDPDHRVIPSGAVAVNDGAIVAVGSAAELGSSYDAAELLIPADNDLVIPGLVNGHGHAAMSLFRGLADDMRLKEWLEGFIFPAEAELVDADFVRVGTRLAALEMIRTGTTTFADMYYFEDVVAEVTRQAGLRGVLGETVLDFPAPDNANVEEALAYSERFLQRWHGDPLIVPAVAPHAPTTTSPETLRRCAELARAHGAPLLIHLAETRDEVNQIKQQFKVSPVQYLASLGFLGPDVIAAHLIWVDAADIRTLVASGTTAIHNPESNMKLASGTMPLRRLRAAGILVGLGTDGAASNNDLDMFGAINAAALLRKQVSADPSALPAAEALAMATIEGARALGLDTQIGSLEVGKRADIVVISSDSPHQVPRYEPTSQIVYATGGADVRATIVDGRILYRDGQFNSLDSETIKAAAAALATRITAATAARR